MTALVIEKLSWDSNHFGLQVGRLLFDADNCAAIEAALRDAFRGGYDVVYVVGPQPLSNPAKTKLRLADKRVTFYKDLSSVFPAHKVGRLRVCRDPSGGERCRLHSLAVQSAICSRFVRDPNFDQNQVRMLFHLWLDKALLSTGQQVMLSEVEGALAGMITVELNDADAQVGLLAVDPDYRGHGLGSQLLEGAASVAREAGLTGISVATQSRNAGACGLYAKNGFVLKETTWIYHAWR